MTQLCNQLLTRVISLYICTPKTHICTRYLACHVMTLLLFHERGDRTQLHSKLLTTNNGCFVACALLQCIKEDSEPLASGCKYAFAIDRVLYHCTKCTILSSKSASPSIFDSACFVLFICIMYEDRLNETVKPAILPSLNHRNQNTFIVDVCATSKQRWRNGGSPTLHISNASVLLYTS